MRFPAGAARLRTLVAGHAGRYLVPRDDGTVLAGSTMDEVGFDRSIVAEGLRIVQEASARLVPALATREPREWWADLRPVTRDHLPIVGPDPDLRGLFYATGYGRNGILLSPLAGEIVADLALRGSTSLEWQALSPERLICGAVE